ncbi:MAG TPA: hypothetical protein VF613_00260 [Longimicrobium sp.]|jgi:hypothetical protein
MTTHPDEAALLGLMDGALDPAAHAAADAHVSACAACRAELDLLRRRMRRLEEVLARTDFPLPSRGAKVIPLRRAVPGWLRAAAVLLAVVGAAALATPARAWLSGRWSALAGVQAKPAPAPRPGPAAPASAAAPSAYVRFDVAGPAFALHIQHPQRAGTLLLRAGSSSAATAQVVPGTGSADLLVLPSGLRIGNAPGSAAEYVIVLPPSVQSVAVRVGDASPVIYRASRMGGAGVRVPLARR